MAPAAASARTPTLTECWNVPGAVEAVQQEERILPAHLRPVHLQPLQVDGVAVRVRAARAALVEDLVDLEPRRLHDHVTVGLGRGSACRRAAEIRVHSHLADAG